MTIELNTASWHYRLYNWIQIKTLYPANLCAYIGSFIVAILFLPLTLGTYLIAFKGLGAESHAGRIGAGFAANIVVGLLICCAGAILAGFGVYNLHPVVLFYTPIISIAAFPTFFWGAYFCFEVFPKIKEKFCPKITWKSDNY